jgi:hypothetical protein
MAKSMPCGTAQVRVRGCVGRIDGPIVLVNRLPELKR